MDRESEVRQGFASTTRFEHPIFDIKGYFAARIIFPFSLIVSRFQVHRPACTNTGRTGNLAKQQATPKPNQQMNQ